MLDSRYFNINEFYSQHNDRRIITDTLFKLYWPDHTTYFINSWEWYSNISEKLINHKRLHPGKHIIISQVEEDWLYHYDLIKLRKEIASCPVWTDKSFLITNSRKDFKISKNYINTVYKPGILDLVSYIPYKKHDLDIVKNYRNIIYHTGYFYKVQREGRAEICNVLTSYKDKCSAIYYKGEKVVDNANTAHSFNFSLLDAPYLHISNDAEWVARSAFLVSIETFNGLNIDRKLARFAPTLSEKTFRAMHLFRPNLIYGGTGTRQLLNNLGFDTWDWLIDWSYDLPENRHKSFELFVKELHRLMTKDITEVKDLIIQNKKALLHNNRQVFKLIKYYNKGLINNARFNNKLSF